MVHRLVLPVQKAPFSSTKYREIFVDRVIAGCRGLFYLKLFVVFLFSLHVFRAIHLSEMTPDQ